MEISNSEKIIVNKSALRQLVNYYTDELNLLVYEIADLCKISRTRFNNILNKKSIKSLYPHEIYKLLKINEDIENEKYKPKKKQKKEQRNFEKAAINQLVKYYETKHNYTKKEIAKAIKIPVRRLYQLNNPKNSRHKDLQMSEIEALWNLESKIENNEESI